MSDLKAALQRLADRADENVLPPPSAIRAAGDRRTRQVATATAGVAVLAAVVAAVALTGLPDSARDGAPRPADRTATSIPSPEPSAGWETIEPQWGKNVSPRAVAANGSRFVLVADNSGGQAREPIWWSDDGRVWTRASGAPDSPNITDVIATDAGFLASAVSRDGGAVYWSSDGRTWERGSVAPSERGDVDALWGLTETDLGYFSWDFVDERRSSTGRATAAHGRAPAFGAAGSRHGRHPVLGSPFPDRGTDRYRAVLEGPTPRTPGDLELSGRLDVGLSRRRARC